jgi:hypothetical protein
MVRSTSQPAGCNAAIAAELNARKVPTARGKEWTHVQVGAVLARASARVRSRSGPNLVREWTT